MKVTINGVNTTEGLARFAGNEKIYVKSLLRFAENYPPLPPDAAAEERKAYCHSIKGVAGNLGIYELAASAAAAEQAISDIEKYNEMAEHMNMMCQTIKSALESESVESAKAVVPAQSGSREECLALVAALKAAAGEFNPSECEKIMEKLRSAKWSGVTLPDLSVIAKAIEDYDFGAIPAILDKI